MEDQLEKQDLFSRVSELIEQSRHYVAKAINTAMAATYYEVGRYIVEDEQSGKVRAAYGKQVLPELSTRLTEKFGKGWSVENLKMMRRFYMVYSNSVNTAYPIQADFHLPWSHYIILMRIENPDERKFYEIEAAKENWSSRFLQRQIGSSLYERLALSRNKDEVMLCRIKKLCNVS